MFVPNWNRQPSSRSKLRQSSLRFATEATTSNGAAVPICPPTPSRRAGKKAPRRMPGKPLRPRVARRRRAEISSRRRRGNLISSAIWCGGSMNDRGLGVAVSMEARNADVQPVANFDRPSGAVDVDDSGATFCSSCFGIHTGRFDAPYLRAASSVIAKTSPPNRSEISRRI